MFDEYDDDETPGFGEEGIPPHLERFHAESLNALAESNEQRKRGLRAKVALQVVKVARKHPRNNPLVEKTSFDVLYDKCLEYLHGFMDNT